MATLALTYDTGAVPLARINDAFAAAYAYQATLPDGTANPESKAQFARRKVREYIRDVVRAHEAEQARRSAEAGVAEIQLT